MKLQEMSNRQLITAIELLERISYKNAIAFMTLKEYREELRIRCEQVFLRNME